MRMLTTTAPRANRLGARRRGLTGWATMGVTLLALLALTVPTTRDASASDEATEPLLERTSDEGIKIKDKDLVVSDLTLKANGLRFDVLVAGPKKGEIVMLLHGFPLNNTQWIPQIEALAAAGYRVVAPNLRGYSPGAQPVEVAAYAMDMIASDLIALTDELKADRVHLVGHDYGAVAAWHAAATYPDRVISMTSISSPHPDALARAANDPTTDQLDRLNTFLPLFSSEGSEAILLDNDAFVLREVILAPAGIEPAVLDGLVEFFQTGDTMKTALHFFRAGGLDPAAPPLGPVEVPVMYLWGAQDPQLGPDAAVGTADFVTGDYRFEVLDVNHWVTYQAPDAVTARLLDYLGGF